MRPVFGIVLATVASLATTGDAHADGLKYTVGTMIGASQSPFESSSSDTSILPYFSIEGEQFKLDLSGLTYGLTETENFTLSARLAPRWVSADPSDTPGLEQLKRDVALEAGLAAGLTFGQFTAGFEALKDISDTHDGMVVSAAISTGFGVTERLAVGVTAGVTWMDKNLATYSYGVRASEAGGSLAAYQVNASLIPSIGVEARYTLTDHVSLVGGAQIEFLPDNVTGSPIVQRDTVTSAMLGMRYAF
ncbi:hypothetical protein DA792_00430 (plasmid) [Celeribacter baekdonensis]|uniref:Outer membrane protein n=1 Tax=Celeribacter baekdonensis TaxID=875171 RepID=A0A2R4LXR3_9RHOB|nr:hypothetical protein DA792_00430 [Celeribacter baekdonensis]